jgi:hypothetical protein
MKLKALYLTLGAIIAAGLIVLGMYIALCQQLVTAYYLSNQNEYYMFAVYEQLEKNDPKEAKLYATQALISSIENADVVASYGSKELREMACNRILRASNHILKLSIEEQKSSYRYNEAIDLINKWKGCDGK